MPSSDQSLMHMACCGSSCSNGRRSLLKLAGAGALSFAAPQVVIAQTSVETFSARSTPSMSSVNARAVQVPSRGPSVPKWPMPGDVRQIWLKRPQTGEEVIARYYNGSQLDMNEYIKVCQIMRDVRGKAAAYIDIELLDLIFAIQSWLVAWQIDRPGLVLSGFRSENTNGATEGAAKNSMHLKGRAVDLRMPGVPANYISRLVTIFGVGGVGFYASSNFVHADTGRVRYWKS